MCGHEKILRSNHPELSQVERQLDRRNFLQKTTLGLGALALGNLLNPRMAHGQVSPLMQNGLGLPHFVPKAKRVVYLFQSGGPSQLDLFDYKPELLQRFGQDLPASVRSGQRLTGMSADQSIFPIAPSTLQFSQYGESGAWVSEAMPYLSEIVDDLCFIKSMQTDAINHDPAITFLQTGNQIAGRPSIGSWLSYGLGSDNDNLPTFITLISKNGSGQPLYARLWGNGFLPTEHQGVQFRAGKDPVLYLSDPENYDGHDRRQMLDYLKELNGVQHDVYGDPEINARIAQYEMAFRMQTSVPAITDLSDEKDYIFDMYGEDSRDPGTYAANCLMARRLLEQDVKFVQLYHQGWDQHGDCPGGVRSNAKKTDQATAALIKDLKQRGMLEDTLVIWGGEFGRTVYSQGQLSKSNYGRDHHPKAFTMFMAGAGIKPGITYGSTDEFCYNVTENPVHVHDFHATLLHLFGIDHERLIYKVQGRRFRLTDVHGHVVQDILS
ncbi:DUF1501 domain-containing protein [Membranihabitans marinus]|uniref:DUF1501 domain-containing protein n=1 Tax=Membranihabitans marinus TaxID=1227546 RepID=UPI001F1934EF|nr:DUF1501 domain-containing protein [Membranihabitans marinus]